VNIKPHHFVDILAALGGGRSRYEPHPYGHALHTVAHRILADREVCLRIELGADDICAPCRHNVGGTCDDVIDTSFRPEAPASKNTWNLRLDRRWCEALGLKQGDELTAGQLCGLIAGRIDRVPGIYRELPPDRTLLKQRQIEEGARLFPADRTASK